MAVEANPILVNQMRKRFDLELREGRLILENCVVSQNEGLVDFYVHKFNSVLSQLSKPQNPENFYEIKIPSKRPSRLIKKYGFPEYIKIDLEGLDFEILSLLFADGIHPRYISAELHDFRVYEILTSLENYKEFKLLEGISVGDMTYKVPGLGKPYTFPFHSAGPMFEDIPTSVLNAEAVLKQLRDSGLGWKDLHAKRQE